MNFKSYYILSFNYELLFGVLLILCFSCENSSEKEISIANLKESFLAKDKTQFIRQFPKNFQQLNSYFGWNGDQDKPEELSDEANQYIDYYFSLLTKENEKNIISICDNGHWEADAISYFQDKTFNYIKEKNKFYLVNDLENSKAESVLFFLFDSPHPKYDEDFADNLNEQKKDLLRYSFEKELFDQDDIEEGNEGNGENLDTLSSNAIEENTNDISGEYELVKGYTRYIGQEDEEILSANIIIEKLSDTDYGFLFCL